MEDHLLDFEPRLKGLSVRDWSNRLYSIATEFGKVTELGPDHTAYFLQAGPKLLVTFESVERIRASKLSAEPRGFIYAREEGWSCLTIISERQSWFRDPAIYRFFDDLTDDGFFEGFDDVLFYGAHAGGYAAAAYCVASPGSRVLAVQPQATLDPRITGFDARFKKFRRFDFTSRYGFAPEMTDAALHAYVVFDPMQQIDAAHAALFAKRNVSLLQSTGLGKDIETAFDGLGTHDDMMLRAMDGRLTTLKFAKLMRARRAHSPYIRRVLSRALKAGHTQLAANLCAYVLRQNDDPFFRERLTELAAEGIRPARPVITSAAQ